LEPTEEDYIDELLERFRDSDEQQCKHAVRALVRLGRRAVPALLEALQQDEWAIRRYAATVFTEAPDARAIPLLCEALSDVDWEVRREAARALKVAAPAEAAEPLVPLVSPEEEHPQVRLIAIEALAAIHERDADGRVPAEVWERAIPSLCAAMGRDHWRLHCAAATLLGDLRASAAVDPLWAALDGAQLPIALRIVEALGKIGGRAVIEPLRLALTHREKGVRGAAAETLGHVGGDEALMLLCWALRSQDPGLRRGAAWAVAHLAKSNPSPALRAAREPLRRLLSPLAWPPAGTDRALFKPVLHLVELATADVRDLPLPSLPGERTAQLPRPSESRPNAFLTLRQDEP